MGAITIIREIKQIHPNYVALVRMGGFYRVYGKDAYILSNIFEPLWVHSPTLASN